MKYTFQSSRYDDLRVKTRLRELFTRLRAGFSTFSRSPWPMVWTAVYWLLVLALYRYCLGSGPILDKITTAIFLLGSPALLGLYLLLVILFTTPRRAYTISDAFLRAGLVNHAAETPFVMDANDRQIVIQTNGIPLEDFKDNQSKLESALNCRIIRWGGGRNLQQIIIRIAPGNTKLPTKSPMLDIPQGDTVLSLGVSLDGPLTVDLSIMPHILIGGSTGSGKTYLVLSLIKQALDKGMDVNILDMKGGVDYPPAWKGPLCNYDDSRETILNRLSALTSELKDRKLAFGYLEQEMGKTCASLEAYNRMSSGHRFSRILVVCDELAEITDTTGLDKPTKELVNVIIGKLGTLARLGRAFGIHLILATQRPDANVVPGQIKNNADVRICGRSDTVLSTIIMDNGDAAELPKDIPGRFLCNLDGGTIFQGYMLPDLGGNAMEVDCNGLSLYGRNSGDSLR